jgi:hypothetical protein
LRQPTFLTSITGTFSGTTLNIPPTAQDLTPHIVSFSRERYAADKASVEQAIRAATETQKVQAQTPNHPKVNPAHARKAASAAILHADTPTTPMVAPESASAKRRARRKRAAEALKGTEKPAETTTPANNDSTQPGETIVRLR